MMVSIPPGGRIFPGYFTVKFPLELVVRDEIQLM